MSLRVIVVLLMSLLVLLLIVLLLSLVSLRGLVLVGCPLVMLLMLLATCVVGTLVRSVVLLATILRLLVGARLCRLVRVGLPISRTWLPILGSRCVLSLGLGRPLVLLIFDLV